MLITPTSYRKKHLDEVKSERKQRERERKEGKKIAFPIFTRADKRFFPFPFFQPCASASCLSRLGTIGSSAG